MPEPANVLVIGGTSGIGRAIAASYVANGAVVTVAGRSADRSQQVAEALGDGCRGLAVDVSKPDQVADALAGVGKVSRLILTAVGAGENSIGAFDTAVATELATVKLVGYPAVIAALQDRFQGDTSILVLGGNAMDKPFPGSLSLTSVNGGVARMVVALAVELAPRRVNAIHPGVVVDTPSWKDAPSDFLASVKESTPTGEHVTTAEIADAAVALLENKAITGQNLRVDGGSGL